MHISYPGDQKKKKERKKWKWWLTLLASFRHHWKGSKEHSLLQGKHLALWIRHWLSEECWTNFFLSKLYFFSCVVVLTPILHLGQQIEPAVYGLHCVLPIDCETHPLEIWCLLLLKMFTIYYVGFFFCLHSHDKLWNFFCLLFAVPPSRVYQYGFEDPSEKSLSHSCLKCKLGLFIFSHLIYLSLEMALMTFFAPDHDSPTFL